MTTDIRTSGIDVVGDMVAWGAHFCLFYETREDLLETLTSYCGSGLERGEYCMWIVADPLTIDEAKGALKSVVPDIDRHLAESRLELVPAREWFLQGGTFDGKSLTQDWYDKLARVSARGYPGMRVTGDTTWLSKKDWVTSATTKMVSTRSLAISVSRCCARTRLPGAELRKSLTW